MHTGQPVDPKTHIRAVRLAWKLIGVVQPCLRHEELTDVADEFYREILADLSAHQRSKTHA